MPKFKAIPHSNTRGESGGRFTLPFHYSDSLSLTFGPQSLGLSGGSAVFLVMIFVQRFSFLLLFGVRPVSLPATCEPHVVWACFLWFRAKSERALPHADVRETFVISPATYAALGLSVM
jgi:hypothetical protein